MDFKRYFWLGLLAISPVWSNFSVEPFILVLHGNAGQLTGWVTLKTNQNNKPVAVELAVHRRVLDEQGIEDQNSPESNQLVVYPSEAVVFPGEPVKVQISWAGNSKPDRDMAFTLVASEVPLNLNKGTDNPSEVNANISTLVRYRAVVAIETGLKGRLVVKSAQMNTNKQSVDIQVENAGLGRVPTDGMNLMIRGVKYPEFLGKNGNSIMPGEVRNFTLQIPFIPKPSEISFGF